MRPRGVATSPGIPTVLAYYDLYDPVHIVAEDRRELRCADVPTGGRVLSQHADGGRVSRESGSFDEQSASRITRVSLGRTSRRTSKVIVVAVRTFFARTRARLGT